MSYVTTGPRMALGLAGGALTGATLFCLYVLLSASPAPFGSGGGSWAIALVAFIYAAVIWSAGLVAVGLPVWILLHVLKRRHWLWAVSVGAVLTFGGVYWFATETNTFWGMAGFTVGDFVDPSTLTESEVASRKWQTALRASFVLGAIGAVVALAIWRIAYRRVPVSR